MKRKDRKPGPNDKLRANEGEKLHRTLEVLGWLRTPLTREEILERAKPWKLQPRQIDNYLHDAKEILRESFLEGVEENKSIILSKLWEVYEMAMRGLPKFDRFGGHVGDVPDLSAANAALKNIAHVQGLLSNRVDIGLSSDAELEDVPTEVLITYAKSTGKKDPVANYHHQGGPLPDPP
jgi:hypothetical protein